MPPVFRESLQHFNFEDPAQRSIASKYRDAEVPFKMYNVPEFKAAGDLWTNNYLSSNLKEAEYIIESSNSNHFMFYNRQIAIQHGLNESLHNKSTSDISRDEMNFDKWQVRIYFEF